MWVLSDEHLQMICGRGELHAGDEEASDVLALAGQSAVLLPLQPVLIELLLIKVRGLGLALCTCGRDETMICDRNATETA